MQHIIDSLYPYSSGSIQSSMCPNARQGGLGRCTQVRYCVRVARRPRLGGKTWRQASACALKH